MRKAKTTKNKTKVKIGRKDNIDKGNNKYGNGEVEKSQRKTEGGDTRNAIHLLPGTERDTGRYNKGSVFSRRRTSKRTTSDAKDKHKTNARVNYVTLTQGRLKANTRYSKRTQTQTQKQMLAACSLCLVYFDLCILPCVFRVSSSIELITIFLFAFIFVFEFVFEFALDNIFAIKCGLRLKAKQDIKQRIHQQDNRRHATSNKSEDKQQLFINGCIFVLSN